mmetsp:Transcript_3954/g.6204  ORF Transcript_3954/g.6204 Transcript_3954/m.6204 type:complete len:92 (+) Transcript_3954:63-338(+)
MPPKPKPPAGRPGGKGGKTAGGRVKPLTKAEKEAEAKKLAARKHAGPVIERFLRARWVWLQTCEDLQLFRDYNAETIQRVWLGHQAQNRKP